MSAPLALLLMLRATHIVLPLRCYTDSTNTAAHINTLQKATAEPRLVTDYAKKLDGTDFRHHLRLFIIRATLAFPPNECADVTANMGRKAINLPQAIAHILTSAGPTPPMPDPPQFIELSDALCWTCIQEAQDPIVSLHCTPTRKIKDDLIFSCATANVLSLKGGQEAGSQPVETAFPHIQLSAVRRLDLAQQFESQSLTIIGLQETRGRAPKGWGVAENHTYAAPANSRGQGCQWRAWCHTGLSLCRIMLIPISTPSSSFETHAVSQYNQRLLHQQFCCP